MKEQVSRRELFRRAGRYAALGVAGVTAAWLGTRAVHSECTNSFCCGNCPALKTCRLPEARQQRVAPDGATHE
ncbi:MAG TPA: hypothetical protein VGP72_07430 [Planctomycetota bacterium]